MLVWCSGPAQAVGYSAAILFDEALLKDMSLFTCRPLKHQYSGLIQKTYTQIEALIGG